MSYLKKNISYCCEKKITLFDKWKGFLFWNIHGAPCCSTIIVGGIIFCSKCFGCHIIILPLLRIIKYKWSQDIPRILYIPYARETGLGIPFLPLVRFSNFSHRFSIPDTFANTSPFSFVYFLPSLNGSFGPELEARLYGLLSLALESFRPMPKVAGLDWESQPYRPFA